MVAATAETTGAAPVDHAGETNVADNEAAPPAVAVSFLDGAEAEQPEADYVVPVARPSRSRIVAMVAVLGLLVLAVVWWKSGSRKAPVQVIEASHTVSTAHEPLPPPPPPGSEAVEPNADTQEEPALDAPKAAGASAIAEPSAAPAFGPNVARYPDLPTPVLLQLEKDQEEKEKSK